MHKDFLFLIFLKFIINSLAISLFSLVDLLIFYIIIIIFTYLFFQDSDDPGLLEQLKSQICENIGLYAQKYDEEFSEYLPEFVTAVWSLLTTTGQEVKYDLVS